MTASDQFKSYEIHFIRYGIKKRLLQRAVSMTDANAWYFAAIESGVPAAALPNGNFLELIMTAAQNQGISKVRWNVSQ
jgi:hypothetical protein